MYYLACPQCNKKVIDDISGYRCETCEKVYSQAVPSYIINAKVSDPSGSVVISFIKTFKEEKQDEYKEFLNSCCFKVLLTLFDPSIGALVDSKGI